MMDRIHIFLSKERRADVEKEAKKRGLKYSDMIRRMVDFYFEYNKGRNDTDIIMQKLGEIENLILQQNKNK